MYGIKLRAYKGELPSVIGEVAATQSGNLILRVGRVIEDGGWEQTEYVVLNPVEAIKLVGEIREKLGVGVEP